MKTKLIIAALTAALVGITGFTVWHFNELRKSWDRAWG